MKIENDVLISDYNNQKYPLDSFDLIGEVEYQNGAYPDKYTGWTFAVKVKDSTICIINPNLECMDWFFMIPSGNEQNVREVWNEIFEYKNGFVLPHEPMQFELTDKGKLVLEIEKALGHDAAIAMLENMDIEE